MAVLALLPVLKQVLQCERGTLLARRIQSRYAQAYLPLWCCIRGSTQRLTSRVLKLKQKPGYYKSN